MQRISQVFPSSPGGIAWWNVPWKSKASDVEGIPGRVAMWKGYWKIVVLLVENWKKHMVFWGSWKILTIIFRFIFFLKRSIYGYLVVVVWKHWFLIVPLHPFFLRFWCSYSLSWNHHLEQTSFFWKECFKILRFFLGFFELTPSEMILLKKLWFVPDCVCRHKQNMEWKVLLDLPHKDIPSLKLTHPLKTSHPKRKRSSSNHPFSGATMLVSGKVFY